MNAEKIIDRNYPWCDDFDDLSFMGILHEDAVFNFNEYFLLEWALYKLNKDNLYNDFLYWKIFRIFSFSVVRMRYEFIFNEEILKITYDAVNYIIERMQIVFEGYFQKQMPNFKICFPDLKNPYLTDDLLS